MIAYASRGLSRSEENYPVHKQEFLALKWAVTEKFYDYLYGNRFEVWTDNNPLTYVMSSAKLDAAGQRWIAALANFDFSISYHPGSKNTCADFLSRSVTVISQPSEVVQAVLQVIPSSVPFVQSLNVAVETCDLVSTLPSVKVLDVGQIQDQDAALAKVKQLVCESRRPKQGCLEAENPEVRCLLCQWPKLLVEDGVLFRRVHLGEQEVKQLVVPKAYRSEVLEALHDNMGHLGRDRTLELVQA